MELVPFPAFLFDAASTFEMLLNVLEMVNEEDDDMDDLMQFQFAIFTAAYSMFMDIFETWISQVMPIHFIIKELFPGRGPD